MQVDEGQLRDFLIDSGLVTRGQLAALSHMGGETSLYELLSAEHLVTEDELRRAAAFASGTTFVVLKKEDLSPTALLLIPEPIARMHNLLAYRLEGRVLEVALLDLDDLSHVAALNLPYTLRPRLTSRTSIKEGLLYYQKIVREKFSAALQRGEQVVDALIHHALLSSAHGVHIDLHTAALVRYRIGEALREAMQLPLHLGVQLSERLKTLAKLLPVSSTVQEGRFKFEKDGEAHIVHVSALPTVNGERLVLRLARESHGAGGFALTSLGLHGATLENVHTLLRARSGLVLVAGPKGGGKTTTLYTLLDQLNHTDLSIATIEEKIEHRFAHLAQTQVRPEAGVTSLVGLRAVLKQDPDVVMVGDIQDAETLTLAAQAANRGVLVFAGVEAASVGAALDMLREAGVSVQLLAAVLRGVTGVNVVKKICMHDSEKFLLTRGEALPLEERANFGRVLAALKEEGVVEANTPWKEVLFTRTSPCGQCEGGYQGVVGVQEVLLLDEQTKEMLKENILGEDIESQAREGGTLTLLEDALFKAAAGQTSLEEVFRVAEGEGR